MNLKADFKDHSKGAFRFIDGELRLVGKFGQISMLDDLYDIWLVSNPPMSKRQLTYLLRKAPVEADFTVLDGEAYTQTRDLSLVRELALLCGIHKKRKVTQETLNRLKSYREVRT